MNKNYHDVGRGRKAVQHGQRQAIGPMSNPRHPKKFAAIPKPQAPEDPEKGDHSTSHLDSGESCDCIPSRYAALTPANREKVDAFVHELVMKQKTAPSAANTEDGKETTQDH